MTPVKKLGDMLARIVSSVFSNGGQQAGGGGGDDLDPTDYILGMKKQAESIGESYSEDHEFEKAVCSTLASSMGLAAVAPGATVALKFAAALPELKEKMPEFLQSSGLDKLVHDYSLKGEAKSEAKINDVVSKFTSVSLGLGGAASAVSSQIIKYIGESVPKSPMEKSGLIPDIDEVTKSIEKSMEHAKKHDKGQNHGPNVS